MKKFAFLVGVTMIVMAGVVVSQQTHIDMTKMLRGEVYDSSSSYSEYASSVETESSSSYSYNEGATEFCELKIVNGILQQCCKSTTPYNVFHTCRQYSDTFDTLCEQAGLNSCDEVSIRCDDEKVGHRVNTVQIDGKKCYVEPQSGVIGCEPDNTEEELICAAMGKSAPCECHVSASGDMDPSDHTVCALDSSPTDSRQSCYDCCERNAEYHRERGDPLVDQWVRYSNAETPVTMCRKKWTARVIGNVEKVLPAVAIP